AIHGRRRNPIERFVLRLEDGRPFERAAPVGRCSRPAVRSAGSACWHWGALFYADHVADAGSFTRAGVSCRGTREGTRPRTPSVPLPCRGTGCGLRGAP